MADRARDPEALEREIERTRLELARNIDELAERVNPRNVAHRGAERLKEEAGQVVKTVQSMVALTESGDGEPGAIDRRVVLAGVGVAAGLTVLLLWRRKRRR